MSQLVESPLMTRWARFSSAKNQWSIAPSRHRCHPYRRPVNLTSVAEEAARQAGSIIQAGAGNGLDIRHKGAIDMVTQTIWQQRKPFVFVCTSTHRTFQSCGRGWRALGRGHSMDWIPWMAPPPFMAPALCGQHRSTGEWFVGGGMHI